jgi:hypothetical protein
VPSSAALRKLIKNYLKTDKWYIKALNKQVTFLKAVLERNYELPSMDHPGQRRGKEKDTML